MNTKPDAILTADWHLRTNKPRRRIDNFFESLAKKIQFIFEIKNKYNIPILDAGDLFNTWRVPPWLETWTIENIPHICTIPGNHDLPDHNIQSFKKSSLSVIEAAEKITIINDELPPDRDEYCRACLFQKKISYTLFGFHWNYDFKNFPFKTYESLKHENEKFVALIHNMVDDRELTYKDPTFIKGSALMEKMRGFDLIVTGHNHKSFVIRSKNQLLVNPGSIMRTRKDQINFKPRIYLWYAADNTIEPVFLPIKDNVFSENKIREEKENEELIESYVSSLTTDYEFTFSFEKNLENYFRINKTRKPVKEIIERCIHGPDS